MSGEGSLALCMLYMYICICVYVNVYMCNVCTCAYMPSTWIMCWSWFVKTPLYSRGALYTVWNAYVTSTYVCIYHMNICVYMLHVYMYVYVTCIYVCIYIPIYNACAIYMYIHTYNIYVYTYLHVWSYSYVNDPLHDPFVYVGCMCIYVHVSRLLTNTPIPHPCVCYLCLHPQTHPFLYVYTHRVPTEKPLWRSLVCMYVTRMYAYTHIYICIYI